MSEIIWQRALQHFQAQRFSEAIADCEQLIRASPVWVMAFPLLSSIYMHLDQVKLATYYAVAATQHLDRLNWQGILSISSALILVGENRLAHDILQNIETRQFQPETAGLHLGRQYSSLEDIQSALAVFESAIAGGDKSAVTKLMFGLNCALVGRIQEARNAYESAIALEPELAHAHWALAQVGQKENALHHVESMQRIFSGKQLSPADKAYVDYAFFKEYERIGEADLAWASLIQGAKARKSEQPYNHQNERKIFEALAMAFAGIENKPAVQQERTPIFIVGMPRTGTTLLERILGNHPEIVSCGELTVIHQQLQWLLDRKIPLALDEASIAELPKCNFGELGQRYLQKTAWLCKDEKYFTDKHPMNFLFCGAILKALPGARIIHMRRNPIDTCFSNFKELFTPGYYPYSYDLADCAAHYRNYRTLMQAWHSQFPGKILDVSYENLVADPAHESARIFDYLGLEYTGDVIEIENNKSVTTTASSLQVREGIHSRNIEGWKLYAEQLSGLRQDLHDAVVEYEQQRGATI